MKEIRENFQQVLQINQKLGFDEKHQVFKLFFVFFAKFMERELKNKDDQSEIQSLFKEGSFVRTLFCFSIELNQLTNKEKRTYDTQSLVQLCNISFLNLWSILFHFAFFMGKNLPIIIRAKIVEIECNIILNFIWSTKQTP